MTRLLPKAACAAAFTLLLIFFAAIESSGADDKTDRDAEFQKLLKTIPGLKEKIDSGQTTRKEVLDWFEQFEKFEAPGKGIKGGTGKSGKGGKNARDVTGTNFPATAFEYAKLVESELGVPPTVDLDKAVEIPLYVDGVKTLGELPVCDNPTLLGKTNMSGSMIQRYPGRTRDGRPLKDVVWVAFARHAGPRFLGSVQMIGYNRTSGATAFFESCDAIGPWVRADPVTTRLRGVMPGTDDPQQFNQAYVVPGQVQCVQCHQNEPFITDSFINAAKIPGTDESVVPVLDKEAPYYVIGGENWDMRTMHIEGNRCFDCHRVGMETMKLFMSSGWDANEHMPPHAPGSMAEDLAELLDAWKRGPEKTKAAVWIVPPARGKPARVVGDDYPHKSFFNRPADLRGGSKLLK